MTIELQLKRKYLHSSLFNYLLIDRDDFSLPDYYIVHISIIIFYYRLNGYIVQVLIDRTQLIDKNEKPVGLIYPGTNKQRKNLKKIY